MAAPLPPGAACVLFELRTQALGVAAGLVVAQDPRRLDAQKHALLARLARGVALESEVLPREPVDRAVGFLALHELHDAAADLDPRVGILAVDHRQGDALIAASVALLEPADRRVDEHRVPLDAGPDGGRRRRAVGVDRHELPEVLSLQLGSDFDWNLT